MKKIEKIKQEVLEELAKMEREELEKAGREINLENFFEEVIEKIYERAVGLAVRKTAEEIFGEIENIRWCHFNMRDRSVMKITEFDKHFNELKRKWLDE